MCIRDRSLTGAYAFRIEPGPQTVMDVTCRLGLGYRDGPIERVERGGLANHYDATAALFEVYGTPAYAPARRSVVAKQRAKKSWGRT